MGSGDMGFQYGGGPFQSQPRLLDVPLRAAAGRLQRPRTGDSLLAEPFSVIEDHHRCAIIPAEVAHRICGSPLATQYSFYTVVFLSPWV